MVRRYLECCVRGGDFFFSFFLEGVFWGLVEEKGKERKREKKGKRKTLTIDGLYRVIACLILQKEKKNQITFFLLYQVGTHCIMYLRIHIHISFFSFLFFPKILLGSFLCSTVSAPPIPPSPHPNPSKKRERQIFSRFSQSINPVYLIHRYMYMYMCTVRRMYSTHIYTPALRARARARVCKFG